METVDRTGTFRGKILAHGVSKTKNGYPQLSLRLLATQYYDETESVWVDDWEQYEQAITAFLVLFGKDGKATLNCEQIQKVLGWDGKSFLGLQNLELEGVEIQFRVGENEYEGNVTFQVKWIDEYDATPSDGVKSLDADDLKELDKAFAKGLGSIKKTKPKKASGGSSKKSKPKPPSVGKKKEKKAEKKEEPEQKKSDKDTAWQKLVDANEESEDPLDDEALADNWINIVTEIAGDDADEDDISPEQWGTVEEAIEAQFNI